jgi:hypothetical protein
MAPFWENSPAPHHLCMELSSVGYDPGRLPGHLRAGPRPRSTKAIRCHLAWVRWVFARSVLQLAEASRYTGMRTSSWVMFPITWRGLGLSVSKRRLCSGYCKLFGSDQDHVGVNAQRRAVLHLQAVAEAMCGAIVNS